ncbi:hypothetical protein GCM10007301_54600 [Azorhizobium oxalatiphilum]|uniref:Aspartyl protease n=1 Tax=Azorhizobium oxalatiphilum TaxID=980631 RepID=A0A917CGG1_9HYPH|nr:hypothetical protein [Azorhizobium oxalatiphilum]GGF87760.1 hypothetical protein GCM10007301_54600 [Azorhizobium oxalatiphilum]
MTPARNRALRALSGLSGLLLAAGAAQGQTAAPDYAAAGGTVVLPFLNAPLAGQATTRPPSLSVRFPGGREYRATLDTGSTGVVVSATSIPDFAQLPQIGPGTLTYSSSGRIEKGVWVVTPLTISGTGGARVTTRPMPVLAVTEIACLRTARNCQPRLNPKGIGMIGIGFARQQDAQSQGTPDHNPLLNVQGMGTAEQPGSMRRGYVLSRTSVQVGLDAAGTKGFSYVKLEKSPTYPDWAAAPVCISVAGKTPPACGTMLMDTGVTTMFLRMPPEQLEGQTTPNERGAPVLNTGTGIALEMPGAAGVGYSFNVGDTANPVAPLSVILVRADRNPGAFVNTSVRFLNRFDYLYDADGGYVAFRPRPE